MFPGGLGTCELVSVCLSTEDGLNGGLEIVVFEEAAVEGPVFAEEEVPVFLRVGIPPAKRPPSFCPEEPTPESFPDLESAPAEVDFSIEGADLSTVTVFLSFVPCWMLERRFALEASGLEGLFWVVGGSETGGGGGGGGGAGGITIWSANMIFSLPKFFLK
jgi:hypothetical protein